jgi:hypothetical protein
MKQLLFLVLLSSCFCSAQVINVESLRKKTDSAKWTGSASLDISLIKNVNSIFGISNSMHVQYNDKTNLWLFINDLSFQKVESNSFVNRGTQHLRYNRRITETIKLEAFAQSQYDEISQIDFRGLFGIGPRFKLSPYDNYRVYLGTLVMYEYEKASPTIVNRVEEDLRGSAYLSFSLYPIESVSVISTSYYQPKLKAISDYRFSSTTSLLIKIYEDLSFKTNFKYFYDAVPVSSDIPKTQYELTNGLLYIF